MVIDARACPRCVGVQRVEAEHRGGDPIVLAARGMPVAYPSTRPTSRTVRAPTDRRSGVRRAARATLDVCCDPAPSRPSASGRAAAPGLLRTAASRRRLGRVRVDDAVAVVGGIEGDDADAEVLHELDRELRHVAVQLVLEAAVPDADRRVPGGGVGREPVHSRDRLVADLQVEASRGDPVVVGFVDDLHGRSPRVVGGGRWLQVRPSDSPRRAAAATTSSIVVARCSLVMRSVGAETMRAAAGRWSRSRMAAERRRRPRCRADSTT